MDLGTGREIGMDSLAEKIVQQAVSQAGVSLDKGLDGTILGIRQNLGHYRMGIYKF